MGAKFLASSIALAGILVSSSASSFSVSASCKAAFAAYCFPSVFSKLDSKLSSRSTCRSVATGATMMSPAWNYASWKELIDKERMPSKVKAVLEHAVQHCRLNLLLFEALLCLTKAWMHTLHAYRCTYARKQPMDIMKRRVQRPFASTPAFDLEPSEIPSQGGHEHYQRVLCGLLQLACGGLDECHNLVTPLSWDSGTIFAGSPIYDSPAREDATLVHHLVHLREGQNPGEFGSGWQNSGYWAGTLGSHPIFPQIHEASQRLAQGNERLEKIMKEHFPNGWDPKKYIAMSSSAVAKKDAELMDFCSAIENAIFRIAIAHVHAKL